MNLRGLLEEKKPDREEYDSNYTNRRYESTTSDVSMLLTLGGD